MRLRIREFWAQATRCVALPATVLVSSLVSSLAFGSDQVGDVVCAIEDDIPVARMALPVPRENSAQKPTSAAFFYSDPSIPVWSITENRLQGNSQKPILTAATAPESSQPCRCSVSEGLVQEESGIHLPPYADTATSSNAGISNLKTVALTGQGNQKPDFQHPPVVSRIAQVNWRFSASQSAGDLKSGLSSAFQADDCPAVLWNPNASGELLPESTLEEMSIGACSDLNFAEDVHGKAYLENSALASTEAVHPSVLAQLQQLNHDASTQEASGESYVSDLKQLLRGNSDWLYVNESLLDLAPNEPVHASESYLDDLNSLAAGSGRTDASKTRLTSLKQSVSSREMNVAGSTQAGSGNSYGSLAPDVHCDEVGGSSMESLFQPLSSIHLSGLSTQPPEKDKNQKSAELSRPESQACAYIDNYSPMHYHAPQRYGSSHPSRNTHQLYHNPLYYEDPNIERCGQSYGCLTTAVSVVHFGTAIAFTPLKMVQTCPADCVQALPDCPTCHRFGQEVYCSGR